MSVDNGFDLGDVHGTGIKVRVDDLPNRIPPYDDRSGDHFWVIMAAYHTNPAQWVDGEKPNLDHENLVNIAGPGCYYCEQSYTGRLRLRRCPGDPR